LSFACYHPSSLFSSSFGQIGALDWQLLSLVRMCAFSAMVSCACTVPRKSPNLCSWVLSKPTADNFCSLPSPQNTMALMERYAASDVKPPAAQGVQFILFPEMSALVPESTSSRVDELFSKAAQDAHVQVVLGVLHRTGSRAYNEARVYSATGAIEAVYRKHHLVPSWENQSTRNRAVNPRSAHRANRNRDLSRYRLARRYAKQQVGPGSRACMGPTYSVDADWHGHLSVMPGVEGGFSMLRDAKHGLLTISDDRGRIIAEKLSRPDGAPISMLAKVPVLHESTLYQRWGDWFAWVYIVALPVFWLCSRSPSVGMPGRAPD
jgi:apolipoprotein N-acyltransferase